MLLPTKNGIACDKCCSKQIDIFKYYSTTFKRVLVNNKNISNGSIETDIEICEDCYNKILERMKNNAGNAKAGHIKCDWCDKYYTGIFNYWFGKVDMVDVDVTVQTNDAKSNPIKSITSNCMDFNIGKCCYDDLLNLLKNNKIKLSEKNDWSIKTS